MKHESNSFLFSILLSMNNSEDHEITLEDLRYMYSPAVNDCQIRMYLLVIKCINEGMSYEEIYKFIDSIDIEEYKRLTEEEKVYVKTKIKKDLHTRKNNEKNRGVIDNE